MKPLAIWLVVVAVIFGVLAAIAAALPTDTKQVFVVVDSSFEMRAVWEQVGAELDAIDDRADAEFALATEKGFVHGFQDVLRLGSVPPFAPCDFSAVTGYPQVAEADELIFITTDGSCDTSDLTDWQIRRL